MQADGQPTMNKPHSDGASCILVVDDHEDNIEVLKVRLESWGYRTASAYNGADALKYVETTPPDLILLDELSLGLAPIVIKDIYERLPDITSGGMTVILVEQDVTRALACSSTFICLQEGRVSLSGSPQEHSRDAITNAYFGT